MNAQRPDLVRVMVKAPNDHTVLKYDSIDVAVLSHRGIVMAPQLACNVAGAVGQPARVYNLAGRQVWTGRLMPRHGGAR